VLGSGFWMPGKELGYGVRGSRFRDMRFVVSGLGFRV
jgi:hypothetical protein